MCFFVFYFSVVIKLNTCVHYRFDNLHTDDYYYYLFSLFFNNLMRFELVLLSLSVAVSSVNALKN